MEALVFAVVVLFVLVICLTVAFIALARQVGVLLERVAPMGALVTDAGPRVGERSPQFRLSSLTGGEVVIGAPAERSTLVFFLSPACPVCKRLLPVLHSTRVAESKWLDIVLASDGEELQHRRFLDSARLQPFPYVLSTVLGSSYRVAQLPYAVLVDSAGVIRAKGLVNNREQLESLFNAQELNTHSLQQFLNPTPGLSRGS
jgi:methylamine dehydrogenase accessory protein MauD